MFLENFEPRKGILSWLKETWRYLGIKGGDVERVWQKLV
jgi:hypothetical protein